MPRLEARRVAGARLYDEFLRVPDLSVGLYVLEAGGIDPQSPHTEDEVYYVIAGRARRHGRRRGPPGRAGVGGLRPAREPHRFHDIAERLELLVAFGPAEGSRR